MLCTFDAGQRRNGAGKGSSAGVCLHDRADPMFYQKYCFSVSVSSHSRFLFRVFGSMM